MKKGLGDRLENFTKATGIHGLVKNVSEGLNIPCGCSDRKKHFNEFSRKIEGVFQGNKHRRVK